MTLIPILYALSVSLNGQNSLLSSSFSFFPSSFTLENYKQVLFGENILTWFQNTVLLAAVTVFLSLLFAVPAAYCFSRRRFTGRKFILKCLVLLNSFPAILSMFAIYRLLRPFGLVNNRFGLILVYTGTMAVFSLWNTKGYFDTIPTEIEEAARMDGASDIQVVWRIVLPLAKPSIITTALQVLIYVWNEYIYATTFLTGRGNIPWRRDSTPPGNGNDRKLAGVCGGIHYRIPAGAGDFLPVPEIYDLRSDGRRCEGMKLEAVLHIPMSEYCHGLDENHIVYRIRTGRNDIEQVTLYYGDTACRVTPILFTPVTMERIARDDYHDYWQAVVESLYRRVYYYFELKDGDTSCLYYGDVFTDHLVDDRSQYFKLPFNHRADIVTVPDWVHDAVVYQIFPDSFASGYREISRHPTQKEYQGHPVKGKLGGTLLGIAENADYLKQLGVNCVYLNPIFAAGEYHKYDLLDYFHVDPCFGTEADFRQLVDTLHANGIRILIDGVFNHCGWNFFAFEDVLIHQENQNTGTGFTGWNSPLCGRKRRRNTQAMNALPMSG